MTTTDPGSGKTKATSREGTSTDRARVGPPPPLVVAALAAVGVAAHMAYPAHIFPEAWQALAVGAPVFVIGAALMAAAVRTIRGAETDMTFSAPSSVVVQHGPYGWSRNPIYLAVLTWYTGLAVALNMVWLVAATPVVFVYFNFWVIAREERYLEGRFGDAYLEYKANVRRWV